MPDTQVYSDPIPATQEPVVPEVSTEPTVPGPVKVDYFTMALKGVSNEFMLNKVNELGATGTPVSIVLDEAKIKDYKKQFMDSPDIPKEAKNDKYFASFYNIVSKGREQLAKNAHYAVKENLPYAQAVASNESPINDAFNYAKLNTSEPDPFLMINAGYATNQVRNQDMVARESGEYLRLDGTMGKLADFDKNQKSITDMIIAASGNGLMNNTMAAMPNPTVLELNQKMDGSFFYKEVPADKVIKTSEIYDAFSGTALNKGIIDKTIGGFYSSFVNTIPGYIGTGIDMASMLKQRLTREDGAPIEYNPLAERLKNMSASNRYREGVYDAEKGVISAERLPFIVGSGLGSSMQYAVASGVLSPAIGTVWGYRTASAALSLSAAGDVLDLAKELDIPREHLLETAAVAAVANSVVELAGPNFLKDVLGSDNAVLRDLRKGYREGVTADLVAFKKKGDYSEMAKKVLANTIGEKATNFTIKVVDASKKIGKALPGGGRIRNSVGESWEEFLQNTFTNLTEMGHDYFTNRNLPQGQKDKDAHNFIDPYKGVFTAATENWKENVVGGFFSSLAFAGHHDLPGTYRDDIMYREVVKGDKSVKDLQENLNKLRKNRYYHPDEAQNTIIANSYDEKLKAAVNFYQSSGLKKQKEEIAQQQGPIKQSLINKLLAVENQRSAAILYKALDPENLVVAGLKANRDLEELAKIKDEDKTDDQKAEVIKNQEFIASITSGKAYAEVTKSALISYFNSEINKEYNNDVELTNASVNATLQDLKKYQDQKKQDYLDYVKNELDKANDQTEIDINDFEASGAKFDKGVLAKVDKILANSKIHGHTSGQGNRITNKLFQYADKLMDDLVAKYPDISRSPIDDSILDIDFLGNESNDKTAENNFNKITDPADQELVLSLNRILKETVTNENGEYESKEFKVKKEPTPNSSQEEYFNEINNKSKDKKTFIEGENIFVVADNLSKGLNDETSIAQARDVLSKLHERMNHLAMMDKIIDNSKRQFFLDMGLEYETNIATDAFVQDYTIKYRNAAASLTKALDISKYSSKMTKTLDLIKFRENHLKATVSVNTAILSYLTGINHSSILKAAKGKGVKDFHDNVVEQLGAYDNYVQKNKGAEYTELYQKEVSEILNQANNNLLVANSMLSDVFQNEDNAKAVYNNIKSGIDKATKEADKITPFGPASIMLLANDSYFDGITGKPNRYINFLYNHIQNLHRLNPSDFKAAQDKLYTDASVDPNKLPGVVDFEQEQMLYHAVAFAQNKTILNLDKDVKAVTDFNGVTKGKGSYFHNVLIASGGAGVGKTYFISDFIGITQILNGANPLKVQAYTASHLQLDILKNNIYKMAEKAGLPKADILKEGIVEKLIVADLSKDAQVLIVDEASRIDGFKSFELIFKYAKESNIPVLLLSDINQFSGDLAGASFSTMFYNTEKTAPLSILKRSSDLELNSVLNAIKKAILTTSQSGQEDVVYPKTTYSADTMSGVFLRPGTDVSANEQIAALAKDLQDSLKSQRTYAVVLNEDARRDLIGKLVALGAKKSDAEYSVKTILKPNPGEKSNVIHGLENDRIYVMMPYSAFTTSSLENHYNRILYTSASRTKSFVDILTNNINVNKSEQTQITKEEREEVDRKLNDAVKELSIEKVAEVAESNKFVSNNYSKSKTTASTTSTMPAPAPTPDTAAEEAKKEAERKAAQDAADAEERKRKAAEEASYGPKPTPADAPVNNTENNIEDLLSDDSNPIVNEEKVTKEYTPRSIFDFAKGLFTGKLNDDVFRKIAPVIDVNVKKFLHNQMSLSGTKMTLGIKTKLIGNKLIYTIYIKDRDGKEIGSYYMPDTFKTGITNKEESAKYFSSSAIQAMIVAAKYDAKAIYEKNTPSNVQTAINQEKDPAKKQLILDYELGKIETWIRFIKGYHNSGTGDYTETVKLDSVSVGNVNFIKGESPVNWSSFISNLSLVEHNGKKFYYNEKEGYYISEPKFYNSESDIKVNGKLTSISTFGNFDPEYYSLIVHSLEPNAPAKLIKLNGAAFDGNDYESFSDIIKEFASDTVNVPVTGSPDKFNSYGSSAYWGAIRTFMAANKYFFLNENKSSIATKGFDIKPEFISAKLGNVIAIEITDKGRVRLGINTLNDVGEIATHNLIAARAMFLADYIKQFPSLPISKQANNLVNGHLTHPTKVVHLQNRMIITNQLSGKQDLSELAKHAISSLDMKSADYTINLQSVSTPLVSFKFDTQASVKPDASTSAKTPFEPGSSFTGFSETKSEEEKQKEKEAADKISAIVTPVVVNNPIDLNDKDSIFESLRETNKLIELTPNETQYHRIEEYEKYKNDPTNPLYRLYNRVSNYYKGLPAEIQKSETSVQQAVGNKVDAVLRDFFDDESNGVRPADYYNIGSENNKNKLLSSISGIKDFMKSKNRGEKIIASQIYLYDDTLKIAGSPDMITIDDNGKVRIYDFKTMQEDHLRGNVVHKTGKNKGLSTKDVGYNPGEDGYADNFSKQLSAYRILLANQTGGALLAEELNIIAIKPTYDITQGVDVIPTDYEYLGMYSVKKLDNVRDLKLNNTGKAFSTKKQGDKKGNTNDYQIAQDLKNLMGKSRLAKFVPNIFDESGLPAWASFTAKLNEYNFEKDAGRRQSLFHEILHDVLNFLSPKERQKILNSAKKRMGIPNWEGITNKDAEEWLAKEYQNLNHGPVKQTTWLQQFGSFIANFFKTLFSFVKLARQYDGDIQKLFDDIDAGKFRNAMWKRSSSDSLVSFSTKEEDDEDAPKKKDFYDYRQVFYTPELANQINKALSIEVVSLSIYNKAIIGNEALSYNQAVARTYENYKAREEETKNKIVTINRVIDGEVHSVQVPVFSITPIEFGSNLNNPELVKNYIMYHFADYGRYKSFIKQLNPAINLDKIINAAVIQNELDASDQEIKNYLENGYNEETGEVSIDLDESNPINTREIDPYGDNNAKSFTGNINKNLTFILSAIKQYKFHNGVIDEQSLINNSGNGVNKLRIDVPSAIEKLFYIGQSSLTSKTGAPVNFEDAFVENLLSYGSITSEASDMLLSIYHDLFHIPEIIDTTTGQEISNPVIGYFSNAAITRYPELVAKKLGVSIDEIQQRRKPFAEMINAILAINKSSINTSYVTSSVPFSAIPNSIKKTPTNADSTAEDIKNTIKKLHPDNGRYVDYIFDVLKAFGNYTVYKITGTDDALFLSPQGKKSFDDNAGNEKTKLRAEPGTKLQSNYTLSGNTIYTNENGVPVPVFIAVEGQGNEGQIASFAPYDSTKYSSQLAFNYKQANAIIKIFKLEKIITPTVVSWILNQKTEGSIQKLMQYVESIRGNVQLSDNVIDENFLATTLFKFVRAVVNPSSEDILQGSELKNLSANKSVGLDALEGDENGGFEEVDNTLGDEGYESDDSYDLNIGSPVAHYREINKLAMISAYLKSTSGADATTIDLNGNRVYHKVQSNAFSDAFNPSSNGVATVSMGGHPIEVNMGRNEKDVNYYDTTTNMVYNPETDRWESSKNQKWEFNQGENNPYNDSKTRAATITDIPTFFGMKMFKKVKSYGSMNEREHAVQTVIMYVKDLWKSNGLKTSIFLNAFSDWNKNFIIETLRLPDHSMFEIDKEHKYAQVVYKHVLNDLWKIKNTIDLETVSAGNDLKFALQKIDGIDIAEMAKLEGDLNTRDPLIIDAWLNKNINNKPQAAAMIEQLINTPLNADMSHTRDVVDEKGVTKKVGMVLYDRKLHNYYHYHILDGKIYAGNQLTNLFRVAEKDVKTKIKSLVVYDDFKKKVSEKIFGVKDTNGSNINEVYQMMKVFGQDMNQYLYFLNENKVELPKYIQPYLKDINDKKVKGLSTTKKMTHDEYNEKGFSRGFWPVINQEGNYNESWSKVSPDVSEEVKPENISSKGSTFAQRLTNYGNTLKVKYKGVTFRNAEHAYQTWKSGIFDKAAYDSDKAKPVGAFPVNKETNFDTMVAILTAKLQQHADLLGGINSRGGLNYIEQSTHNVGKTSDLFWETRESQGGKNMFLKALAEAYKNVQEDADVKGKVSVLKREYQKPNPFIEHLFFGNMLSKYFISNNRFGNPFYHASPEAMSVRGNIVKAPGSAANTDSSNIDTTPSTSILIGVKEGTFEHMGLTHEKEFDGFMPIFTLWGHINRSGMGGDLSNQAEGSGSELPLKQAHYSVNLDNNEPFGLKAAQFPSKDFFNNAPAFRAMMIGVYKSIEIFNGKSLWDIYSSLGEDDVATDEYLTHLSNSTGFNYKELVPKGFVFPSIAKITVPVVNSKEDVADGLFYAFRINNSDTRDQNKLASLEDSVKVAGQLHDNISFLDKEIGNRLNALREQYTTMVINKDIDRIAKVGIQRWARDLYEFRLQNVQNVSNLVDIIKDPNNSLNLPMVMKDFKKRLKSYYNESITPRLFGYDGVILPGGEIKMYDNGNDVSITDEQYQKLKENGLDAGYVERIGTGLRYMEKMANGKIRPMELVGRFVNYKAFGFNNNPRSDMFYKNYNVDNILRLHNPDLSKNESIRYDELGDSIIERQQKAIAYLDEGWISEIPLITHLSANETVFYLENFHDDLHATVVKRPVNSVSSAGIAKVVHFSHYSANDLFVPLGKFHIGNDDADGDKVAVFMKSRKVGMLGDADKEGKKGVLNQYTSTQFEFFAKPENFEYYMTPLDVSGVQELVDHVALKQSQIKGVSRKDYKVKKLFTIMSTIYAALNNNASTGLIGIVANINKMYMMLNNLDPITYPAKNGSTRSVITWLSQFLQSTLDHAKTLLNDKIFLNSDTAGAMLGQFMQGADPIATIELFTDPRASQILKPIIDTNTVLHARAKQNTVEGIVNTITLFESFKKVLSTTLNVMNNPNLSEAEKVIAKSEFNKKIGALNYNNGYRIPSLRFNTEKLTSQDILNEEGVVIGTVPDYDESQAYYFKERHTGLSVDSRDKIADYFDYMIEHAKKLEIAFSEGEALTQLSYLMSVTSNGLKTNSAEYDSFEKGMDEISHPTDAYLSPTEPVLRVGDFTVSWEVDGKHLFGISPLKLKQKLNKAQEKMIPKDIFSKAPSLKPSMLAKKQYDSAIDRLSVTDNYAIKRILDIVLANLKMRKFTYSEQFNSAQRDIEKAFITMFFEDHFGSNTTINYDFSTDANGNYTDLNYLNNISDQNRFFVKTTEFLEMLKNNPEKVVTSDKIQMVRSNAFLNAIVVDGKVKSVRIENFDRLSPTEQAAIQADAKLLDTILSKKQNVKPGDPAQAGIIEAIYLLEMMSRGFDVRKNSVQKGLGTNSILNVYSEWIDGIHSILLDENTPAYDALSQKLEDYMVDNIMMDRNVVPVVKAYDIENPKNLVFNHVVPESMEYIIERDTTKPRENWLDKFDAYDDYTGKIIPNTKNGRLLESFPKSIIVKFGTDVVKKKGRKKVRNTTETLFTLRADGKYAKSWTIHSEHIAGFNDQNVSLDYPVVKIVPEKVLQLETQNSVIANYDRYVNYSGPIIIPDGSLVHAANVGVGKVQITKVTALSKMQSGESIPGLNSSSNDTEKIAAIKEQFNIFVQQNPGLITNKSAFPASPDGQFDSKDKYIMEHLGKMSNEEILTLMQRQVMCK